MDICTTPPFPINAVSWAQGWNDTNTETRSHSAFSNDMAKTEEARKKAVTALFFERSANGGEYAIRMLDAYVEEIYGICRRRRNTTPARRKWPFDFHWCFPGDLNRDFPGGIATVRSSMPAVEALACSAAATTITVQRACDTLGTEGVLPSECLVHTVEAVHRLLGMSSLLPSDSNTRRVAGARLQHTNVFNAAMALVSRHVKEHEMQLHRQQSSSSRAQTTALVRQLNKLSGLLQADKRLPVFNEAQWNRLKRMTLPLVFLPVFHVYIAAKLLHRLQIRVVRDAARVAGGNDSVTDESLAGCMREAEASSTLVVECAYAMILFPFLNADQRELAQREYDAATEEMHRLQAQARLWDAEAALVAGDVAVAIKLAELGKEGWWAFGDVDKDVTDVLQRRTTSVLSVASSACSQAIVSKEDALRWRRCAV